MSTMGSPPRRAGLISRILFKLAGANEATLQLCGEESWDHYRSLGLLLIGSVSLEAVVLSVIAHETLEPDGKIHIPLIAGAIAVSALIGAIDRQMFLRGHEEGVRALRAAGLELPSTFGDKVRSAAALVIRGIFSLSLAQLSAVFMGLILFQADIAADMNRQWQAQNSTLIAETKAQVENEVQRAASAVKAEEEHVASLQSRLGAMRDGAVNPNSTNPAMKSLQDEVSQLLAAKAKREEEQSAAAEFATDELSGVKGRRGNSGTAGRGWVRAAAEERLKTATANVAAADRSLADARSRFDELRKQMASTDGERSHEAKDQVPDLEKELQGASAQLATLRGDLARLTDGRETRIRELVESAPDHVGRDDHGLLARLGALKRIAADSEIGAVILLIDVVTFSMEMGLVLAKATGGGVNVYAAWTARNSFMDVTRIVEEMTTELDRRPNPESEGPQTDGPEPESGTEPDFSPPPCVNATDISAPAPKRPRGRPRKNRPDTVH